MVPRLDVVSEEPEDQGDAEVPPRVSMEGSSPGPLDDTGDAPFLVPDGGDGVEGEEAVSADENAPDREADVTPHPVDLPADEEVPLRSDSDRPNLLLHYRLPASPAIRAVVVLREVDTSVDSNTTLVGIRQAMDRSPMAAGSLMLFRSTNLIYLICLRRKVNTIPGRLAQVPRTSRSHLG
ncbi:hypothetical protein BDM02DRAFT_3123628 [Thelephora ganbajun]|uniref:Uncharacterized protein n=1 Tax=Thelephora ganbajun TaxID=370292 RepID=A0ACB6Z0N7_THEGA|nr:hypothetical protein BDM02DRAFT_3123628 [Thelephora ganbajun]